MRAGALANKTGSKRLVKGKQRGIVAPAVERLSQEFAGQLKTVKVNTDLAPALQERFGIRSIPTLVLIDGGKERDRVTGALNVDALRGWVEQRLPARSKPQGS